MSLISFSRCSTIPPFVSSTYLFLLDSFVVVLVEFIFLVRTGELKKYRNLSLKDNQWCDDRPLIPS